MPKTDTREWPSNKTKWLSILAKDGYTAREIGARLGYSRNAVIGKARRSKIQLDIGNRSNKSGFLQSQRFGRKDKIPTNNMPPKEPMGDGCLWPMGDKWCGCDRQETGPYCTVHAKQSRTGQRALTDSDIRLLISG